MDATKRPCKNRGRLNERSVDQIDPIILEGMNLNAACPIDISLLEVQLNRDASLA